METSSTIIGIILAIFIGIPFYYVIRSQNINKATIKKILVKHSQNNHYNFNVMESQNKKVLALDETNKGFLLMDFNSKIENVSFVNLKKIKSCKLIPTNEKNSDTIIKIEFEFQFKENNKKELIPFYTIENDPINQVCLYEDHQLAKKWVKTIEKCI